MLDSQEVRNVFREAEDFARHYHSYQLHPESGIRRAVALSALGALEQAVRNQVVSRETSPEEEIIDGPQPPF